MLEKIKIAFLTLSLDIGGTEKQISLLAWRINPARFEPVVLSFFGGGQLEKELSRTRVRLVNLKNRRGNTGEKGTGYYEAVGRWDPLRQVIPLISFIKREKLQVVYSFLSVPNNLMVLVDSTVAYGICGEEDKAREMATEVLRISPHFSSDNHAKRIFYKDPADLNRYVGALQNAGLN